MRIRIHVDAILSIFNIFLIPASEGFFKRLELPFFNFNQHSKVCPFLSFYFHFGLSNLPGPTHILSSHCICTTKYGLSTHVGRPVLLTTQL